MSFSPLRSLNSLRPWLRGGIIGVLLCIALFIFYIVLFSVTARWSHGMLPNWVGVPAMVTGHLFVLLSGLMLPFGLMCKATVADCVNWSIEPGPGRIPWVMEGQAGYCVNKIMVPTSTCAQLAEVVGFWGLVLGLLAIYFLIGAIVGVLIEKWKKRKI